MAAIKGRNTKPELTIRKSLYKKGFRYRVNVNDLPGKPDLVFSRYKAVLFVNGCFWHKHNCSLFKWPKTRQEFWYKKISGNVANDKKKISILQDRGWRVGIIWECSIKGKNKLSLDDAIQAIIEWLKSEQETFVIQGS